MRKGQNPTKDAVPAYQAPGLGVAIVTYIPSPAGYFEHSLSVLKYEIASLHHATSIPFDLYIFDNGSCSEVRQELIRLQEEGWIDFVFASRHNLGKIGMLNWILGSVPNELICYADSDVLFRPGWYEHSRAILDSFPKAGLVAAQPCLDDVLQGQGRAEKELRSEAGFRLGEESIDPRWIDEYVTGFGYTPDKAEGFKSRRYPMVTHLETGTRAVIGASHVQFLIPRPVARQVVPLPATMSLSRQEDLNFNRTLDGLGYHHISTLEPYYYHMGNTLDENVLKDIARYGLDRLLGMPAPSAEGKQPHAWLRFLRRLSRLPVLGSIIYRSYKLLFEIYSQR